MQRLVVNKINCDNINIIITAVNVSPKRLSRNKNKIDEQIVTIVGYDVEYDDGTGEEYVEPERIKDR